MGNANTSVPASSPLKIRLTCKSDAVQALLAELNQAPREVREAFVSGLERGAELFRVELDVSTASLAEEMVVRIEPTEALLRLVPASRAGNGNGGVIEHAEPFDDVTCGTGESDPSRTQSHQSHPRSKSRPNVCNEVRHDVVRGRE